MKIFSQSLDSKLKDIAPARVAVAYIGAGWQRFLDSAALKEIALSPTLGSNPRAIVEVANTIGWENVYFLDELHSKLYIGKQQVMLGSANLSANGLGSTQQHEACVVLEGEDVVIEANELFESYKAHSIRSYPDTQSKRDQVELLRTQWNRAKVYGLSKIASEDFLNSGKPISLFSEYEPDRDGQVDLAWCTNSVEFNYTDAVPERIQSDIAYEVHLASDDPAPINQWILSWTVTNTGYADKRSKPILVFIHETILEGTTDTGYEQLCYQRTSLKTPPKPFDETDPLFVECFREVIDRQEFDDLRGQIGQQAWRLCDYRELNKSFLEELRKEYLIKQSA